MRLPSWRLILRVIALVLLVIAIIFWILTLFAWFITQPGFEPVNVLAGAIASSLLSLFSYLKSSTISDAPIINVNVSLSGARSVQDQRNREKMLEKVNIFWVKGVLEKSLHNIALIELGMVYRPDAVGYSWDLTLQRPERPDAKIPRGTKVINLFDQVGGSLLILGAPGSGKTTTLLELTRDLLIRAERDCTHPIPVVFNLSSWTENRSIADWLVDELNIKYQVPRRIGRNWVENNELRLLLDGLDEVTEGKRAACVEAINQFRQEYGLTDIVVCSRTQEYDVLTNQLNLNSAIVLQPLTPEQINDYLTTAGSQLAGLRIALESDAALQELAQTPLMLSVMSLAYQAMPAATLVAEQTSSVEDRRKHLFDVYVQRMFARRARTRSELYARERTICWLAWLARRMSQHMQSVFLIEQMQPSWLETQAQRRFYTVGSKLIGGLLCGCSFGLFFVLFERAYGLVEGLFIGLVATLVTVQSLYGSEDIAMVDSLGWSWKTALERLILVLLSGLAFGLLLGLIEVLQGGKLSLGLLTGLGASGLLIALLLFSPVAPMFGLISQPMTVKTKPNQGTWQSAKNALLVGMIIAPASGLLVGLLFGLFMGLRDGLSGGLFIGGFAGLIVGHYLGCAFIQHFILRFVLYCKGYMPWNYARFLNYAAERIFLQQVGGGFVFIHRLLLEYFATLET